MANVYYHKLFKIMTFGFILLPLLSLAQVSLGLDEVHPINIDSLGGFGQRNVPIQRKVELKLAPVRRHARFELFDETFAPSTGKPLLDSKQKNRVNPLGDNRSSNSNLVAIQIAQQQENSSNTQKLKQKFQNLKSPKQRNFMSIDELAAKQFQRVMKSAEKLNIIEHKDKIQKPLVVARLSGNPGQGSISQLMRSTLNNGVNGYKLRRGPYEDAYHTQIMDDFDAVSSMLGTSIKDRHEPTMNEVLSQIMLRENWDIFRL